jgi:hypothetical protein
MHPLLDLAIMAAQMLPTIAIIAAACFAIMYFVLQGRA